MTDPRKNLRAGKALEKRIVDMFQKEGFTDAVRAWGSNGHSFGEHEAVDVKVAGYKIQVKRRSVGLPKWLGYDADVVDGVIYSEPRSVPMVLIPLPTFIRLLKGSDNG